MSKLDELIKKLCPDGVEYKRLSEVFITRNGYTPSKSNSLFWENGTIPWFRMDDIRENGHILSKALKYVSHHAVKGDLFPADSIIVATSATIGEHALITVPSLANQRFTYLILKDEWKCCFDIKFIFYYCYKLDEWCLNHLKQGNFASVDIKKFADFKFPIPPLEVQREIVKILDNFTELTARKKQYEYYRNRLLTFEHNCRKGKIIDMLARPITDGPHTTPEFTEKGIPFISAEAIWDGKIHFEKKRGYIAEAFDVECCKKYKPQKNDVFMVKSGSTTGKVAYVDTNERFNVWSPLAAMRVNQENNPRFLFYLLQSEPIQKMVHAKASHGSQPNLSMRALEQFDVMIPPLDVQNRIVEVLDNFDKVCNDLHIGLPAEIEARKKQYEFYRDSLLTFLEKGESILTDRQTDRQTELKYALIKLLQYVFGYVHVRLSDVALYRNQRIDYSKVDVDTYIGVDNLMPNRAGKRKSDFVPVSGVLKGYCVGDILIGNIRPYLKKIWLADNDGGTNGDVLVITCYDKFVVNANYLYYVLSTDSFFLYDAQHSRGAKMPRGDKKAIMEYEFSLPTMDRQEKVVEILNRFDTLCHDISSGLPAEIEARKKQYEYYRDKLLSFKEKKG